MNDLEIIRLEEYVFQNGAWKSIDELEDSITLEELHRLYTAQRRKDHEVRSFTAALKGVKLDPFKDPDDGDIRTPDQIKEAAMARRAEFLGIKDEENPDLEFGYEIEE